MRKKLPATVAEELGSRFAEVEQLWIERDGYITLHLTPDEAERIAHALPFDNPLAVRIRQALRGPLTRNIVY